MNASSLVVTAVGVLIFLWVVGAFNRLVRLRNEITNAFAMIDVQLKRRYDLIPNLVETARKYLQHERDTLEAVIAARNKALTASDKAAANPADAGAQQGIGARRSTAEMAAGFQCYIGGSATGIRSGGRTRFQRLNFGMILPGRLGMPLTQHRFATGNHTTDARIGGGNEHTALCQAQRTCHHCMIENRKHRAILKLQSAHFTHDRRPSAEPPS